MHSLGPLVDTEKDQNVECTNIYGMMLHFPLSVL